MLKNKNNPQQSAKVYISQIDKKTLLFDDSEDVHDRVLNVAREGNVFSLPVLENLGGEYELVIPKYATWIERVPASRALTPGSVQIRVNENPIDQIERRCV